MIMCYTTDNGNTTFTNLVLPIFWSIYHYRGSGAIDLAGSGPVHMCGGVAALVMGIILGKNDFTSMAGYSRLCSFLNRHIGYS